MKNFYLDKIFVFSPREMDDDYLQWMIIKSGQILSTVHRLVDGELSVETSISGNNVNRYHLSDMELDKLLPKASMINHSVVIWCKKSIRHYSYMWSLFSNLLKEFEFRFNEVHSYEKLYLPLFCAPEHIEDLVYEEPPVSIQKDITIKSYYIQDKHELAKWTKRQTPKWFKKA